MRELISDLVDNPSDSQAYNELIEFVPEDKIAALFDELRKPVPTMAQDPMNETSPAGNVAGYVVPLGSGSGKPKKTPRDRKNENLVIVNEVMKLIMERGI